MLTALRRIADRIVTRLVEFYDQEPVRFASYIAAALVFVAAKRGVVISEQQVLPAILLALPILLGGEGARRKVSPVK